MNLVLGLRIFNMDSDFVLSVHAAYICEEGRNDTRTNKQTFTRINNM